MFNKIKSYFTTDKPLVKSERDYLVGLIKIKNQQLQELLDENLELKRDRIRMMDKIYGLQKENAPLVEYFGGRP